MDERPVTRYAKAPDGVSLAYQVTGDGPSDVLFLTALSTPIDLMWDIRDFVRFATRIDRFSRAVWYEFRGAGASGGDILGAFAAETADTDLTAVLDAVGFEQVTLIGSTVTSPTAIRYAATNPNRVAGLILVGAAAHFLREDDYPWGLPSEFLEQWAASVVEQWGTGAMMEATAPSKTGDQGLRALYARSQRLGIGTDQARAWLLTALRQDVRSLLPTVTVPTLVLHREGDRFIPIGAGRYLAEHIPGAKYVELLGDDHSMFTGDTDALLDEIEEFLTGTHQAPEGDVVTATILFTDIVSSTEQVARMGHRKWSSITDQHFAMVRATLSRYRGHEVDTAGDGFFATFDAATRAVRAAMEIVAQAKGVDLEVRAGVHTGEVEIRPDGVLGLSVSIAKRICDLAGAGEVFVSDSVRSQLVGSGIATFERGTHVLKGVPDEWRLFSVEG